MNKTKKFFYLALSLSLFIHILFLSFLFFKKPPPIKKKKVETPITIALGEQGNKAPVISAPKPKIFPSKKAFEKKPSKKPPHNIVKLPSKALPKTSVPTLKSFQENSSQKQKAEVKNVPISKKPSLPQKPNISPPSEQEKTSKKPKGLKLDVYNFAQREEKTYDYLTWLIIYLNKQARERDLYPKEAKELGLHGTVVVRLTIEKDGHIDKSSMRVIQSSGIALLDKSAISILLELSPFKPPPHPMTVNIPVHFIITTKYAP